MTFQATARTRTPPVPILRPLLAAVLLASLVLALAVPSATAQAPGGFVGLQSWRDPSNTHLKRVKDAKVTTFRMQVSWKSIDRKLANGSHRYDWRRYDPIFDAAARRGIRIMPRLIGSPNWAASLNDGRPDSRWPPKDASARRAFNRFTYEAVKRYGPNGDFWDKRRSYAKPAVHWQIWNEPNLPNYWKGRPNAREYAGLVIGAADAANDGAAKNNGASALRIVAAGLPWGSVGPHPPEFLRGVFAVPRASEAIDAVAIHPYGKTPDRVMSGVKATRDTLRSISSTVGSKPMWLTEIGWATGGGSSSYSVDRSTQARYLTDIYNRLLAARKSYKVLGAFWFNLLDVPPPAGKSDAWYYHTGLFDRSDRYKPAWQSLKRLTGAL